MSAIGSGEERRQQELAGLPLYLQIKNIQKEENSLGKKIIC
jgi:hypothetical protein